MSSTYVDVAIGDLFRPQGGKAKYIGDFVENNPGKYPVWSASLAKPFGFVDQFDYDGHYLTWVMNGYGGRVREATGRFSANRDRGVLLPLEGVRVPDLTYLRAAIEPQLVAAAVGRRVDGRLNEYTKVYSDETAQVTFSVPVTRTGQFDFERMSEVGAKLRRIETAQANVMAAAAPLERAVFPLSVPEPSASVSLGDKSIFTLSIGERVLRKDHVDSGVPVYSANALVPFGHIADSNLTGFDDPSLLWGIDGTFDWNFIDGRQEFATTDHCGRLQVCDERFDPFYVYCYLKATRGTYGFDRVFRASLRNMRADVEVLVPIDQEGQPSLDRQRALARNYQSMVAAREGALASLQDVMQARLTHEL